MVVLLILTVWALVAATAVGLCQAAARGDRGELVEPEEPALEWIATLLPAPKPAVRPVARSPRPH